jgi:hypothetical protein
MSATTAERDPVRRPEPVSGRRTALRGHVGRWPVSSVSFYEAALHVKTVAREGAALNRAQEPRAITSGRRHSRAAF